MLRGCWRDPSAPSVAMLAQTPRTRAGVTLAATQAEKCGRQSYIMLEKIVTFGYFYGIINGKKAQGGYVVVRMPRIDRTGWGVDRVLCEPTHAT
jgi:hypothetical protein